MMHFKKIGLRTRFPADHGRERGFTLIELVIVLSVLAVIIAIAYPSYREQVIKTRRAEGTALLTQVAQEMERCYTRFNAYNNAACAPIIANGRASENDWYRLNGAVVAANTFTLTAEPQRDQANSDLRCANLTLTHAGVRGRSGTAPEVQQCW
ncbi:MAG TPA: type IV pilin protein [Xanthomonadaceae bacterium]|nr:type IV pilin protein [Xanthomonadaceae bacterium]